MATPGSKVPAEAKKRGLYITKKSMKEGSTKPLARPGRKPRLQAEKTDDANLDIDMTDERHRNLPFPGTLAQLGISKTESHALGGIDVENTPVPELLGKLLGLAWNWSRTTREVTAHNRKFTKLENDNRTLRAQLAVSGFPSVNIFV